MDFAKQIIDCSRLKRKKIPTKQQPRQQYEIGKKNQTVKYVWHWDVKRAIYFSFVLLIMQMKIYKYFAYMMNELELSIERHIVQTCQTHG